MSYICTYAMKPERLMNILPTLFVSHGAPTLPFEEVPARDFLRLLPQQFARPRAILVVSAHWETATPCLIMRDKNTTLHDFAGFAPILYTVQYPAPGDPLLAQHIATLLQHHGYEATLDAQRGLDHGAWAPLMLAWPAADIPVLQLSIQSHLDPAHHLALGRALSSLKEEGVLIVASGSFTHDLASWRLLAGAPEPPWVTEFADWFDAALTGQRTDDLLNYATHAPHAARNHPTPEHLLPLFVALGAAGPSAQAQRLHSSSTYSVLRMDAYSFSA